MGWDSMAFKMDVCTQRHGAHAWCYIGDFVSLLPAVCVRSQDGPHKPATNGLLLGPLGTNMYRLIRKILDQFLKRLCQASS